ncbi:hypothetical protein ACFVH7_39910 [Kitasatospora indigofera]|uniref:hypothetical protein n=1 Tax=Kitasatospora indigofera TaxID=67307 RepID=UPI00363FF450
MSRYLPDPSVPVAPLGGAVHAALAAAADAPLLALVYPLPVSGEGWHVTVVETASADVRFGFPVGEPWAALAEREFARQGYVSLASVLGGEWETLADGGRCTRLYRNC